MSNTKKSTPSKTVKPSKPFIIDEKTFGQVKDVALNIWSASSFSLFRGRAIQRDLLIIHGLEMFLKQKGIDPGFEVKRDDI